MTVFITLDLVAFAGLAVVSVAWIIPSCNTSRFRYRLWRLRDDVADEIRASIFDNDTASGPVVCGVCRDRYPILERVHGVEASGHPLGVPPFSASAEAEASFPQS